MRILLLILLPLFSFGQLAPGQVGALHQRASGNSYSFVNSISVAGGANGGTTGGINTTAMGSIGLICVAVTCAHSTVGSLTVSDNKGNSYTLITSQSFSSTNDVRVYRCFNPSVGTGHTFTVGGTGTLSSIGAWCFGTTLTPSVDAFNGSATLVTGNVTPTVAGDLIFTAAVGQNSFTAVNTGYSTPLTWPFTSPINYAGGGAYQIVAGTSPIGATWVNGGAANASVIVAFK